MQRDFNRQAPQSALEAFVHRVTVFQIGVFPEQSLFAWTDIAVGLRVVSEVRTTKESAISLVVNRAHHGNEWCYACLFALRNTVLHWNILRLRPPEECRL